MSNEEKTAEVARGEINQPPPTVRSFSALEVEVIGNCSNFSDFAADRCCTCKAVEGSIGMLMFSMSPSFSAEFRRIRFVLFATFLKSSFISS